MLTNLRKGRVVRDKMSENILFGCYKKWNYGTMWYLNFILAINNEVFKHTYEKKNVDRLTTVKAFILSKHCQLTL